MKDVVYLKAQPFKIFNSTSINQSDRFGPAAGIWRCDDMVKLEASQGLSTVELDQVL